jgi:glycosyltransferase involved in cell wall biosynthesis
MLNHFTVSIIMPAYNAEKYIGKAIESILNQSYTNIELLIADDASTDNTRKIIDKYATEDSRILTFHNLKNLHYLKTCNKLFPLCKGEFITFQDADDWSDSKRIELQVEHLINNPHIAANAVNFIKTDESEQVLFKSDYPCEHNAIVKEMPKAFPVLAGSIMIRRFVLDTVGDYHQFFERIGAEHLYWYYLITEKYEVANLSQHLYYYRRTPNSITGKVDGSNLSKLIILDILEALIKQRQTNGADFLEKNNIIALNKQIRKIIKTQKHIFKLAEHHSWNKDFFMAFKTQLKGLWSNPIQSFQAYKALFYYFRKMLQRG